MQKTFIQNFGFELFYSLVPFLLLFGQFLFLVETAGVSVVVISLKKEAPIV